MGAAFARVVPPLARWVARCLPVVVDERVCHGLGALGSVEIACDRLEDRAVHQDVAGERELVGVSQAGLAARPEMTDRMLLQAG